MRRIIQSSSQQFPNAYIKEADDGQTAVDAVKAEADRPFDFILMDYTMVLTFNWLLSNVKEVLLWYNNNN